MKKTILKSVTAVLVALVSLSANAYDVEIDGIYYNLNPTEKTAAVTSPENDNTYIGSITIPSSISCNNIKYIVTSIGSSAFYNCRGLTSVTIPNGVISIGSSAFRSCKSLTSVNIPNSVTIIDDCAFLGCSSLGTVAIPNSIASIGLSVFSGCSSLTSVTIPNNVVSIGGGAFRDCSGLTSVSIPNSVTSIGSSAFAYCSKLTNITIPNSITFIGLDAFDGTGWYNNQENGLVYVGKVAYRYKGEMPVNTSIIIKEGTTSISTGAFRGCTGLVSVTIPNSVIEIGDYNNYGWGAFQGCSGLTSVTIPDGVTIIGFGTFSDCSGLTSVTIPNSVTYIGSSAFYACSSLTSVTIPNSVTFIGSSAFAWCSSLTSVNIPNSVKALQDYCFNSCSNLTNVISEIEEPFTLNSYSYTFNGNSSTCILTVPYGTKDAYIAKGWTEDVFKGGIIEADNLTSNNYLSIEDAEVCKGKSLVFPVELRNEDNITALQFDLTLPAGVTIAKNSKGKYIVETTNRCADHTLSASKPGDANTYKVLLYSNDVDVITGNSGTVVNVKLAVSDEMEAGDYDVTISNINLTRADEVKITPASVTCTLTISNSIPGDANGDGDIDVTDIVTIANYILGRPSDTMDLAGADANGDGEIDVTDIVTVANIILHGGNNQNNAKMRTDEGMLDPQ